MASSLLGRAHDSTAMRAEYSPFLIFRPTSLPCGSSGL